MNAKLRDRGGILRGRSEIARYLRVCEKTVSRRAATGGPLAPYVVNLGTVKRPRYVAWTEDLKDYLLGIPRQRPLSADDLRYAVDRRVDRRA